MAKQIVALQSAVLEMSKRFPSSFAGYKLSVTESHQSTKADTSGTAKAIVSHLTTLNGEDSFQIDDIQRIREPAEQVKWGVPDSALRGHAFHTYKLTSNDGSVEFALEHNVQGRRIYAEGTADAVSFMNKVRFRSTHFFCITSSFYFLFSICYDSFIRFEAEKSDYLI